MFIIVMSKIQCDLILHIRDPLFHRWQGWQDSHTVYSGCRWIKKIKDRHSGYCIHMITMEDSIPDNPVKRGSYTLYEEQETTTWQSICFSFKSLLKNIMVEKKIYSQLHEYTSIKYNIICVRYRTKQIFDVIRVI